MIDKNINNLIEMYEEIENFIKFLENETEKIENKE